MAFMVKIPAIIFITAEDRDPNSKSIYSRLDFSKSTVFSTALSFVLGFFVRHCPLCLDFG